MKRAMHFLLTLALCLALSLSMPRVGASITRAAETGAWTRFPIYGGNVYSLAVDPVTPATLYAGTVSGGVFRSLDSGSHWTAANSGLNSPWVTSVVINPLAPTTLYAGTYSGGVSRSVDGAEHWTPANKGLPDLRIAALAIDPLVPTTLYAATVQNGIFRSIDSGATWTSASAGLTTMDMRCIVTDPGTANTLYAGTDGNGVFRSTDGGSTWAGVNTGLTNQTVYTLAINPAATSVLYAGTADGVFRTADRGDHWTATSAGLANQPVVAIVINSRTPATLLAALYGSGIFSSTDSGATWAAMNTGLTDKNVQCVVIDSRTPAAAYAGTDGAVFRYTVASSYTLTVTASPSVGGSIGRSPDASPYVPGTVVSLTANPAAGYVFTGWSGDLTGAANPSTITMNADKNVTATFTARSSYTLTPSAGPGGSITPNVPQTIVPGGSKAFTIVPDVGYRIADVSIDGVSHGTMSSYTFSNVTSNHSISARFEEQREQTVIVLHVGNAMFSVNGHLMGLDSPPVIKNGRTLVPIRAIIESLGGTVGWDGAARKATVALGSASIDLWIGKSVASVNGVQTPVDSANVNVVPEIMNGRTMLPLRFVSENLGCSVEWADATKTITITYQP